MAIYHFSLSMVSRSKGRSAVVAATALSGAKLFDARKRPVANNNRKKRVLHTEIMTSKFASGWMRVSKRLWNNAETADKCKRSQMARDVRMRLPSRLTLPEQLQVTRTFIATQFADAGMKAEFAIHTADATNRFGKVILAVRHIDQDVLDRKNRDWKSTASFMRWRAA